MIHAEVKNRIDEDICVMLQIDNHAGNYLCDCGQASLLSVKDCSAINAIFISHTHIDHFINFDQVIRHQVGSGQRVVICGSSGMAERVSAKLRAYTWNLLQAGNATNTIYEVREVSAEHSVAYFELTAPQWQPQHLKTEETKIVYQTEVLTVECTVLNHGIPCSSLPIYGTRQGEH
jgi:ribonuclease Z